MIHPGTFTPPPLPLLITGVAGVAGYNALDYFRCRYPGQVVGIRQRDNFRLAGAGVVACDAEDADELKRLFDTYAFRSVLDCAGNCALRACELDANLARRINVGGVQNLLTVIGSADVRLVHLSVDLVFSGDGHREGGHREQDATDPVTVYGKTMVAAERLLAEQAPWACTLRISLPMGVSFNGHAGAIDWIQSRFKKLKPATLYYDEIRTPTYTDCLNGLCETMLGNRLRGLFHAGAPRPMSLYEIAQVINRVGGYDPDHLMGCLRAAAGPIPPRAGNVSMSSAKLASALGYAPFHAWPYDDTLVPTHCDWHRERPAGWHGSAEMLEEVLYRNPLRRRHEVA
jgi:dTDP-4-dehydrorhamnose reductase